MSIEWLINLKECIEIPVNMRKGIIINITFSSNMCTQNKGRIVRYVIQRDTSMKKPMITYANCVFSSELSDLTLK